jgi:hypothetical protein
LQLRALLPALFVSVVAYISVILLLVVVHTILVPVNSCHFVLAEARANIGKRVNWMGVRGLELEPLQPPPPRHPSRDRRRVLPPLPPRSHLSFLTPFSLFFY